MKALVTPPKKTIEQDRFVMLMRGCWFFNDLQPNYWNEIKGFMKDRNALCHDNKNLIRHILENLRKNKIASFWREFEHFENKDEIFDMTGEFQNIMEDMLEKVYDCLMGYKNRFLCFRYTDYGKGDLCWINTDDKGAVQVKVLGARLLWTDDDTDGEKNEMVIKVIALNKDGKEYGEPFWVRDEHIAKHKKEFTNN